MKNEAEYKSTLHLPKTAFPMKADLPRREPEVLEFWQSRKVYERLVESATAGRFLLHDGPPYANGHIHHGHILNKVLKDIVVKYKNMRGYRCDFIPGWDCHGLPIEHAVEVEIGRQKARSDPRMLRRRCRAFARRWMETQRKEFMRLGVFGEWHDPYLTMDYHYEALIAREFGKFVESGMVYLGKKPVLWCPVCVTALAEAEVEYRNAESPSIWVRFPLARGFTERLPELEGRKSASVVIWTTTPWTLPANLAIALHPNETYVVEELEGGELLILAEKRLDPFHEQTGLPMGSVLWTFAGSEADRCTCRHPFLDRESLIVMGEHVTMDTGTGCVHTAPGHGEEDFVVGSRYGLEPYAPVDEHGRFTGDVPQFEGRFVFDCDDDIVRLLRERGMLVHATRITHSYPHCWRSKNPVVFRAASQWFISVDETGLRERALDALSDVRFIPSWGRERMTGMLNSRPDWCISRQRHWGVPIVAFRCATCGHTVVSREIVDRAAAIFEERGADAWFDVDSRTILGGSDRCPECGGTLQKVTDILDVWFDSGVSYAAVMERRYGHAVRTDLYLEGSDQHRGWFQSSLLASVGTRGQAPYKAVLTHGFVVDGSGRKLAKSEGNYIDPQRIIDKYGADLLRLWAAAEDYTGDIRLSDEILARLVEAYRKIRNTLRFMLGVTSDFDPAKHAVALASMLPQDRYALVRFRQLADKVLRAYEDYQFHVVVREILDFCIVDLSAFYLDIAKDRLYCGAKDSLERRSAQTAIHTILKGLLAYLAPVLSFTAEEAYQHLHRTDDAKDSVFLAGMPSVKAFPRDDELLEEMRVFLEVRGAVLGALEVERRGGKIGHSLDAAVHVRVPRGSMFERAMRVLDGWHAELFVVSQASWETVEDLGVVVRVEKAPGEKCPRCWQYTTKPHEGAEHQGLCPRCLKVVAGP